MNNFNTTREFKRIKEEESLLNIKDIVFHPRKKKWIVTYKNNLNPDEFDSFADMLKFFAFED